MGVAQCNHSSVPGQARSIRIMTPRRGRSRRSSPEAQGDHKWREGLRRSLAAAPYTGHAFPMATTPSSLSGPSLRTIPDGDTRERMVCPDCGFIVYENPKIVVGSVV